MRHAALLPALVLTLSLLSATYAEAVTSTPAPSTPAPSPSGECTVCHAVPAIARLGAGSALFVTGARLAASVHAGLTCTDCHSELTARMHPANDRAASSCTTCHRQEAAAVGAGAHGTPSDRGPSPTCTTCHTAHDVVPADTPAFNEQVATRCAACHTRMSTHTFGSNPLGMETHLGRLDVATCGDCHEAHRVLPASDPASSVSALHKLETCRKCHATAPANFGAIQIHVASGPLPNDLKLRIATVWMLGILIVTFAFFGWLTILGILHEWRHHSLIVLDEAEP